MVCCVIEFHALHAVQLQELRLHPTGLLQRNVGHHQIRGTEGGELLLHHIQSLAGGGVDGQIGGEIVLYLHPVPGKQREYGTDNDQQEKQVPFVHNKDAP
mgnify:CR=1 FL=1